jgi:shikimate dehydrogenase
MSFLEDISPAAHAIGAVNTITLRGGRLRGDNTDAPGFLADLAQLGGLHGDDSEKQALILGAGGSARAVAYGLLEAGWQVVVAARRLEQARGLVNSIQYSRVGDQLSVVDRRPLMYALTAVTLDACGLGGLESPVHLVVNTTPVGMWPYVERNPWPESLELPQGAAVYDLVYNPPETRLLQAAHAGAHPARGGLGMLIEQAALALEHWTGLVVPRQPMWAAVPEFVQPDP